MKIIIFYVNNNLFNMQKMFHLMEDECYALVWGILHFHRYLHKILFLFEDPWTMNHWNDWPLLFMPMEDKGVGLICCEIFYLKLFMTTLDLNMRMFDELNRNLMDKADDDEYFSIIIPWQLWHKVNYFSIYNYF
jgi:hypothetical protein